MVLTRRQRQNLANVGIHSTQLVLMHAVLSALFSLSLSLSLVVLNLVVLNLWSHRLVVLRFGGIAGPQASLFQVAFILHLRFNV